MAFPVGTRNSTFNNWNTDSCSWNIRQAKGNEMTICPYDVEFIYCIRIRLMFRQLSHFYEKKIIIKIKY
jgi:hypothetical protein